MAVTADYDAQKWPDMAHATATDWAPVLALERAIEERWAVARAVGASVPTSPYHLIYGAGGGPSKQMEQAERSEPMLARLMAVRTEIESLSRFFVDMDDSEMLYSASKYATFPITFKKVFEAASPKKTTPGSVWYGDHALVLLPEPGETDWDDDTLDAYRQFLCNAAWWLDRFRYATVALNSFFFRQITPAEVVKQGPWNDPSSTDVSEALEGAVDVGAWRCGGYDARFGATKDPCIKIVHELTIGHAWMMPGITPGSRTERAQAQVCRSYLRVNNSSPLDAVGWVYLVPAVRPTRTECRFQLDVIDANAGTCNYTSIRTTETWFDGWKESYRLQLVFLDVSMGSRARASNVVETTRTYWEDGTLATEIVATTNDGVTVERTKTYLEDGMLVSEKAESYEGTEYSIEIPFNPISQRRFSLAETSALVADPDYPAAEGGAIQLGRIAAYSHSEPIPERSIAPRPAVWNLDLLKEATWSEPTGVFNVSLTTNLCLVPILDFYESFKNGADEWKDT